MLEAGLLTFEEAKRLRLQLRLSRRRRHQRPVSADERAHAAVTALLDTLRPESELREVIARRARTAQTVSAGLG